MRRRRRVAVVSILAVVIAIVVGIGIIDGGSATSPSGAHGDALTATTPAPRPSGPSKAQLRAEKRARALRRDSRAVTRLATRMPYVSVAGDRTKKPEVALTFDDGPSKYTREIVRILRRKKAPATFFTNAFGESWFNANAVEEIRTGRFVIGNHTQHHANLALLSGAQQAAEIDAQTEEIVRAGAPKPQLFRPPYGRFNQTTVGLLQERKMLTVLWTIDSHDYLRPGAQVIGDRVLSAAKPGAIVLMHDGGGDRTQTIAALPRIIHGFRKRGYKLVTVPRLLRNNPPPATQPQAPGG